ncbi:MAG: AAA family ATPase [Clostridia bacterium]|nr:AAA family ATPase [Clostridia bacterium]
MKISFVEIQNFRKLKQCKIDFGDENTLFVGPNNSGKTSAMEALAKFLVKRNFDFNDITLSTHTVINKIGEEWINQEYEFKENMEKWEEVLPVMDVWLDVKDDEIQYITHLIPNLDWNGGKVGTRLILQPADIRHMYEEYIESYYQARAVEENDKKSKKIKLWPQNLCDYIERKMTSLFTLKSYVLDPEKIDIDNGIIQLTDYQMECSEQKPLENIIKIDMIEAQRGFYDPDTSMNNNDAKSLSSQLRKYYDKHLNPEESPSVEDLEILKAMEAAKDAFNSNLEERFKKPIGELQTMGYPGISNPSIKIESKVNATDAIRHESAIQYEIPHTNLEESYHLPEQYNGLGYQNLISMFFRLISYRDDWLQIGKYRRIKGEKIIEPIHLVLVEEPEAHLHMQVQQVFIKQAYNVLTNSEFLKENSNFRTQLIISTHSSHIVREIDFSDLRYFKRLSASKERVIPTTKVINLKDVFGDKDNQTSKFVTRYLRTTHCDIFFADALILVEGTAEDMLIPHFIRHHYEKLNQMYITVLEINGRHSQRLKPLIEKLELSTLVITDIDPVSPDGNHKSQEPKRNNGIVTTNCAIKEWIVKKELLDELLDLDSSQKVIKVEESSNALIRIAYQTPIKMSFNGNQEEAIPSTFEDSLIYSNFEFFSNATEKTGILAIIKKIIETSENFEILHEEIYNKIHGNSFKKAEFALDLIYEKDPKEVVIPSYISEGLEWLQAQLQSVEGIMEGEVEYAEQSKQ